MTKIKEAMEKFVEDIETWGVFNAFVRMNSHTVKQGIEEKVFVAQYLYSRQFIRYNNQLFELIIDDALPNGVVSNTQVS
jgi:hypothetical protein